MNTLDQLNEKEKPIDKIPVVIMPPVDVKALIEEDEKDVKQDNEYIAKPFRFGYAIDVDIDIKKDGFKKEFSNGDKLWLLKIHSADALSINLIYDNFKLGKGSKFYIYNEDRTEELGAFTPESCNNKDNVFATYLVQGDTITLEYYEPSSDDNGVIHINKVIHGYRALGDSAPCNIDVMCSLGSNWRNQQRAVCMILLNQNTWLGSGCLINNTSEDFKPYVLTARHIFFDVAGNIPNSPATCLYVFKYWRQTCGWGNPINYYVIQGATLRAQYAPSDFALLELNIPKLPAEWNLYYAGWDRDTLPASDATLIHHPKGDAMKISHDSSPVVSGSVSASDLPVPVSVWVAHYKQGTVQPGSSGAPMFNSSKRIVGQHCVSPPSNDNNTTACNIGTYERRGAAGKFDISWSGGGTLGTRLFDFLAPLGGVAPAELDGIGEPFISGPDVIYVPNTGFTFVNPPPGTITWEVTGYFTLSPSTGGTTYVTPTNPSGSGTLRVRVNGTVRDEKTITASVLTVYGPDYINNVMSASFVIVPTISGASYLWEDGRFAEITSGHNDPLAIYYVPYGAGTGYDYIGCNVKINGVDIYVYKRIQII